MRIFSLNEAEKKKKYFQNAAADLEKSKNPLTEKQIIVPHDLHRHTPY